MNLYALITGYVCVYSKMQYKRIINLWFEVALCSGIWCLIFFILPDYGISKIELVFSFFVYLISDNDYFRNYIEKGSMGSLADENSIIMIAVS